MTSFICQETRVFHIVPCLLADDEMSTFPSLQPLSAQGYPAAEAPHPCPYKMADGRQGRCTTGGVDEAAQVHTLAVAAADVK